MPERGTTPFWQVEAERFLPIAIQPNHHATRWREACQATAFPPGVKLFIRGSVIEDLEPHPQADLDIVLLAPYEYWSGVERALGPMVARESREVDVHPMTPDDAHACVPTRLLLHTRSLQVHGEEERFRAVPANADTMRAHLRRYGASELPDVLDSVRSRRVCELKQLTRSFGVFGFLQEGRFSRDIRCCLNVAHRLAPEAAQTLEACWATVDGSDDPLPPMPVQLVHEGLSRLRQADWPMA